jgi:hypothetical protein
MKKTTLILLCAILVFSVLTGCASEGAANYAMDFGSSDDSLFRMAAPAPQSTPMPDMVMMEEVDMIYAESADASRRMDANTGGAGDGIMPVTAPVNEGLAEKIIYSVWAEVETIKFEETIDMVHQMLASHGGFIETSNVSGINNDAIRYGWSVLRSAHFTLRIPVDQLNAVTANLDNLGNVVQKNSSADNITAMYIDTQSRLNVLKVEEESFLNTLAHADEVADIIAIREHLSDIRYRIESLTSTLNNWQRQVDYSTLSISIREVEAYTEVTIPHRTYWERIGDGFMSTIRSVGKFFMDIFAWLIVSAPVLAILTVIAVVTTIIVRRKIRSYRKKLSEMPPRQPIQYGHAYNAPGYAPPAQTPAQAPVTTENIPPEAAEKPQE